MAEWIKAATPAQKIVGSVLVVTLLLGGVGIALAVTGGRRLIKRPASVELRAGAPPIDRSAPAEFETATFALG